MTEVVSELVSEEMQAKAEARRLLTEDEPAEEVPWYAGDERPSLLHAIFLFMKKEKAGGRLIGCACGGCRHYSDCLGAAR